jgi:fumarate reductase flavoprotein subunit
VLAAEAARALHAFGQPQGNINALRERLMDTMWNEVGVIRDASGLDRAIAALDDIEAKLLATGVSGDERAFNLTWHDWLNLRSLVEASRAIALAAKWRENSRGAHFRADHPQEGDLAASRFSVVRQRGGDLAVSSEPVVFSRVRPGETLLKKCEAAL